MATFVFQVDPAACIRAGIEPTSRFEAQIRVPPMPKECRDALASLSYLHPADVGEDGLHTGYRVRGIVLDEPSNEAALAAIIEETHKRRAEDKADSEYLAAYTAWAKAKASIPKQCHARGYQDVPYTVQTYRTPIHSEMTAADARRYPARLDDAVRGIRTALGVEQWKRQMTAGNRAAQALAGRVANQDNGYDEPLLTAEELHRMPDEMLDFVWGLTNLEDRNYRVICQERADRASASLKQDAPASAWEDFEREKFDRRAIHDGEDHAATMAWREANDLMDDEAYISYIEDTRRND